MGLVISKGLTLKSYNTPAAIAGVAPTLDYRFALDRREIEAISLTDKLTYTGATNGTFVNRAGLIERATTDQPRFDHNPASRQSLGLLMEEERANLLLWSEEFGTTWTTGGGGTGTSAIVTTNAGQAPNGTTTADRIELNKGAGTTLADFSQVQQGLTLSFTSAASFNVWLRSNNSNSYLVALRVTSLGINVFQAFSVTPSWQRFAVTVTGSLSSANTVVQIILRGTYGTSDGADILAWGAQLEAGAFPTSYIPTTTTSLTRPVDSAVIDGTGVITGTYTLVEKPAGCAVVNGTNIDLVSGFTAERVMVFPAALSAPQITAIRGAM
jgi:hypothetical protein